MKINEIYEKLNSLTKGKIVFLKADNDFQLLIGVILSAQTTDRQVNEVLPELFGKYPSAKALGNASVKEVAEIIRPVGFFNTKARNIIGTAGLIADNHRGNVPGTMEELLSLPGVGRKSANVIRGACFNLPAIIVDTHFARTATRLGLTTEKTPEGMEFDLMKKIPEEIQYRFSMLLNKHGRDFCRARKPDCLHCPLNSLCEWEGKNI